jgi:hypothetical protein
MEEASLSWEVGNDREPEVSRSSRRGVVAVDRWVSGL